MDMISELAHAKSNIFKLNQQELREWVDQFKPKENNDTKSDFHLLYLTAKLKVYDIDDFDDELKEVEDWVTTLLNDNYETIEKDSFSLRIRIEFIEELHLLFSENEHYSRSCELINIIANLYQKYSEDDNIAMVYSRMLLDQPVNICILKSLDLTEVLNKVDELISKHCFNDEFLNTIQFKRELLQIKYYFKVDHSKINEYANKLLENVQKTKKIEDIIFSLIVLILNCIKFDQDYLKITNSLKMIFESQQSECNEYARNLVSFAIEFSYMNHFCFLNDSEKESKQCDKLLALADKYTKPTYDDNVDARNQSNLRWFIGKILFYL